MGTNENGKSSRSEKLSSPAKLTKLTNPTNDHVHPDWAAIQDHQAHYGPRVAIPPYYHYIWGPQQPIVAPYGTPYAAVYTHGNVYAHPAVPFMAATPLSMETLAKSTENGDKGLMKKLKSFDGLAMSLGNGGTEIRDSEAEDTMSMSVDTGGSSYGSGGNLAVTNRMRRKRSCEGTPTTGTYKKTETPAYPSSDKKVKEENVGVSLSKQLVVPVISPAIAKAVELTSPSGLKPPSEHRPQNEKELKRERRKQSNRESARRSRLRKQAEAEELAQKVEFLIAENMSIKSEISQLAEKSKKLKLENASLMGRLNKTYQGGSKELLLNIINEKQDELVCTENLLPRVNDSDSNSNSVNSNTKEERETCPKILNLGPKLHQLLDSSLRTDAVAAS